MGISKTTALGEVMPSLLGQGRAASVTIAAALQALLAVAFLVMPILVLLHGTEAQSAAEAEVTRKGFTADILTRNKVQFHEAAVGLVLPVAIALSLAGRCPLLRGERDR